MEDDNLTYEKIVVTGMSGKFPNSESVKEFMENLFNKVDMVSVDPNMTFNDPEVPKYCGKVKGMEKFDAQFFKVGFNQAAVLEPMSRKLLEHAYGALFDSGNTHATLKGKIIGVFIGSSYADFSSGCLLNNRYSNFKASGSSKAMFANRISYWVDGKGPSFCLDYSCASSTAALEHAYRSMRAGECDAAVVGGCNFCIESVLSLNMKRAGLLCSDGKTKCFDKNGDGYVRSDAVSLIFLQKAKHAKRVYAELCHVQGSYQLKANDSFLPIRKSEDLQSFFGDVYSNIDIDPENIEYVEANGSGLAEADENEAKAIANTFTRNKAVKLGSVKSNMGHSEGASGLCALTKLCLAYHKGEIPANLHCEEPVQPITDGRVQVLTENTKFQRGYSALNNFSLTGAGFHVVLKGHYKEKRLEKYNSEIPRIVFASGRQESCVRRILDDLKSKQVDAEEIALLHNIFKFDIVGHTGRGYTILDTIEGNTAAVSESVGYYQGVRPPLWFVYSGMGSQWAGMGADLMRIPTFAAAIERCDKALSPKGIDIVKVITELDHKMFDNILHAFVGITAVQIGLTDILKEIGVIPDYIIGYDGTLLPGHSLGEMACAYHDDTLTTEELILATYSRAKSSVDADLIKGSMAAVGMGYKALVKLCPPEIDVACHNSSESSTISGPAGVVKEFVEELTKRGIFARSVPCGNIAYHSRYIKDAGIHLFKRLKEIIKNPKLRSKRWISTSVPKEKWDEPEAKYSSAKYHTNNLLNPVLFEEITQLIPDNAVVVEIAPHGLLQAILKRSHKNCTHIPLTKRGQQNGISFLLDAIGKLYSAGFNPKVDILYPRVEFPVSTETPLLSHLVEWEHSEDWPVYIDSTIGKRIFSICRNFVFSIDDDDYKYLEGHVRNGVNVLPEAAFLVFVWQTLAMYSGKDFRDMSVIFKDIQFHSEVIIKAETPVRIAVKISKGSDNFEVTHDDKLIMSGIVRRVRVLKFHNAMENYYDVEDKTDVQLTSKDIYKVLKMRGFDYKGSFQSILTANLNRNKALIKWTDNWIPFLDSLIQWHTVSRDVNGMSKPKLIGRLRISVFEQEIVKYETFNGLNCYDANLNNVYGEIRCAGVEMGNITYTDTLLSDENMANIFESRIFFPFYPTEEVEIKLALKMNMQIVTENSSSKNILITKVVGNAIPKEFEFIDEVVNNTIWMDTKIRIVQHDEILFVDKVVNNTIWMDTKIRIVQHDEILFASKTYKSNETNVIVVENILTCSKKMEHFNTKSAEETFIISFEDTVPELHHPLRDVFNILSFTRISNEKKVLVLMKTLSDDKNTQSSYVSVSHDDAFTWVPDVLNEIDTKKRIVLISERQLNCGILGFVAKLKADGYQNISAVIIDDINAPKFDFDNDLYKNQLQKCMTFNIFKQGQWGSYYSKLSKTTHQKHFALKNATTNLDEVSWVEIPKDDKASVQVFYSGLTKNNCREIVSDDKSIEIRVKSEFGMDFSGIDRNGVKIMGLTAESSVATSVKVDPDLIWQVPNHWTLEDAATVPLAYVQAYYCLMMRAKLEREKSVLILDGTSSVGLALISLCISFDCIIYTVVDSEDKKDTLLNLFPELHEDKIICSAVDFYSNFRTLTKRKGCDIVINFAADPIREDAAKCVGVFGCFLDFSKQDIIENKTIGMSVWALSTSYVTVDIVNIFRPEFSRDKKILQKYISEGISSGVVKPLKRVVFSPLQGSEALKMVSLNKHIGKVLVRVNDPAISRTGMEIIPRISFSAHDVLIIVCDEKGIAIEIADRLISRGARKIILQMHSSVSGYLHTKCLKWNKQEVSIELCSDNLQTEKGSETLMKNAMKFGKVKGIFVVLDPKQTDNATKEDFINAFKKQSLIVKNLDKASRNSIDLSHFVVISRFTQSTSDEYALSLIERVCEKRNGMGLPMLVVRYESLTEFDDFSSQIYKMKPLTISELFNAIETGLKLKLKNVIACHLSKEDDECNITSDIITSDKKGMYTFFKKLDTEEDNVTSQRLLELTTLFNNGLNADLNSDDPYIILIPGFEGRPQIFETVAERFKMRAIAVNLSQDLEINNIQTIASNIREELKRRNLKTNKKFYIMGYSFGVNIALELAALLEKEGNTGIVHCVDGSPDAMRVILDATLGGLSEDQLQNHVINHMCKLITGENSFDIKADLMKLDSYEEKVEVCVKRMKIINKYSIQYKKHLIDSAFKKIILAREYKPEMKLKSEIVLMKSSVHLSEDQLADDYGLSKYSEEPVKVFSLEADHATAPLNIRVPNIVNQFADKDILKMFDKRNLCDVYLA